MRMFVLALAAGAALTQPALAAKREEPKVCLVTFATPAKAQAGSDADVIDAKYLALTAAMKMEAETDAVSDIYTYGPAGYQGPEVDHFNPGNSTKETCRYLSALAKEKKRILSLASR